MFDRRQLMVGSAGALAFNALPAAARTAAARARENNLGWATVQAMLDDYVAQKKIPGGVGAVGRGTDDASFVVAGTIAEDSPRAMNPDSLFRIYSMTKPITGMAAMLLIEDGAIDLDQDIGDFIPGFKKPMVLIDGTRDLSARPALRPVTIRNLLTHTAGLGYAIITKGPLLEAYEKLGLAAGRVSRKPVPGVKPVVTAPSLEAFADRIATLPLIADPGTQWRYSASLDLMGRIIEIASGMAFEQFLQTRIFDPLGMTSTFFQVPTTEIARLTTNYLVTPTGKFPIDLGRDSIYADQPNFPSGGGGLVSSARDYDRFLLMLAGYGAVGRTRIMRDETARLGMSNLLPPGAVTTGTYAEGQGFGAGGRVTIATDGRGSGIGTFGWAGAAATIAWVDPTRAVRAAGYAQFIPDQAMPFTSEFRNAVHASL